MSIKYIPGLHMQETIFKVNTVKEVYIQTMFKCVNYDNFIKQKVKKGIKHVKNVVQSCSLRLK